MDTARNVESVPNLQESAVRNTIDSYKEINESVEKLVVFLQKIFDNVKSISKTRATTLSSIENISAVLEEIAAASSNVTQTSKEQLHSVENLNEAAGRLDTNAKILSGKYRSLSFKT